MNCIATHQPFVGGFGMQGYSIASGKVAHYVDTVWSEGDKCSGIALQVTAFTSQSIMPL